MVAALHEEHQYHLAENDPDKHAQRIDGGITDGRFVARIAVVQIVQGHGVGHTATKHAACGPEVHPACPHGNNGHDEQGYHRNQKTACHPEDAFGPHYGFKEVRPRVDADTGQVE